MSKKLCDLRTTVPTKWAVESILSKTKSVELRKYGNAITQYFNKFGYCPPYSGFSEEGIYFHSPSGQNFTTSQKLRPSHRLVSDKYFYEKIYKPAFGISETTVTKATISETKSVNTVKPIFALVINSIPGTRLFIPCITNEGPGVIIQNGKFILKSELQRIYDSIKDLKSLGSITIVGMDFTMEPGILKKIIEGI